jgi:hypothetical protein
VTDVSVCWNGAKEQQAFAARTCPKSKMMEYHAALELEKLEAF